MILIDKATDVIKEIFQWIVSIIFAVVLALLIRGFLFEPVVVNGESMENTLYTGERLAVYKLGYFFSPPEHGDIIVLQYEEGIVNNIPFLRDMPFAKKILPAIHEIDYIKRVIGIPGDIIDIIDGEVFLNGERINEPYVKGDTFGRNMQFPIKVPENCVFVLGDNRQNSKDSREIGFIEFERIKGKAVFRLWPLDSFGVLK